MKGVITLPKTRDSARPDLFHLWSCSSRLASEMRMPSFGGNRNFTAPSRVGLWRNRDRLFYLANATNSPRLQLGKVLPEVLRSAKLHHASAVTGDDLLDPHPSLPDAMLSTTPSDFPLTTALACMDRDSL
jgi:hypothetical protein